MVYNALEVIVDGQGRVIVDWVFCDYVGLVIDSKVVVVGFIDRVEIWNVDVYDAMSVKGMVELKGSA